MSNLFARTDATKSTGSPQPRLRLIFINRFFHPDHSATSQMLSDLAFGLADRGASVTVITSRLRYDAPDVPLPNCEKISGVEIKRVWTSRFGRSRLIFRWIDYLTFYLAAAWALLRNVNSGDVVVAMTDPPVLSVVATPIAKLRGARLVNWLQDIFPEVAEALDVGGKSASLPFTLLRRIRNASLRRADMNVAIGELMSERLSRLRIERRRIRVLPNWADCEAIKPVANAANLLRTTWKLSPCFVVGYSGNLGRAHEIETVLDAIGAIEDAGSGAPHYVPIRWLFIGGGVLFERMRQEAALRGLQSIEFHGYRPRQQLSESLSAADVHIVSLRPELEGLIVPSKFYGVAAAGRPTIFIGAHDGEIARLIDRHACGVNIATGDGPGLAAVATALAHDLITCRDMGERARTMCAELYSKNRAIDAWHTLLSEVARTQWKPVTDAVLDAKHDSFVS